VKKELKQNVSDFLSKLQDISCKNINKTFLLLEKLENAANQLKSKNLLLTVLIIGQEFPTPITPPAITDALKKHRNKKSLSCFRNIPSGGK